MKRLLWLTVFFTSCSWLFGLALFTPSDVLLWLVLLLLAIVCTTLGLWESSPPMVNRKYLIFLLPFSFICVFIGYPYTIGCAMLFGGILLTIIHSVITKKRYLYSISSGFILTGLLLLTQSLLFLLFGWVSVFNHRVDLFSPLVSFFANLFGLSTSVNNGLLFLQTYHQNIAFTVTWEKLGLIIFSGFVVGFMVLQLLFGQKKQLWKQIIIFAAIGIFYLLLRFVFFLFLFKHTNSLDIFWDPVTTSLSFFPLALIYMKFLAIGRYRGLVDVFHSFSFTRKEYIGALFVFFSVFLLVGSFGYADVGAEKNGRILIDEYHSDWEDSVRPMDTEWYGILSTYNYYSWAEWLQVYYTVDRNIDEPLTMELLQDVDVLILKCPTVQENSTVPYSSDEIYSLIQFVEQGGGLWLIGDHTDVFGMNTFLNLVAEPFGLRLKTDATYELGTGNYTVFSPPLLFAHPCVRHIDSFDYLTSCSIEATNMFSAWRIEPVMMASRVISEPGTYSTENFFRESVSSPESEYGLILQCAAVKHGLGRVLVFTDSTVFSSFTVFSDGYQSFSLGAIEYLNHQNSNFNPNVLFFIGALFCLFASVIFLRKRHRLFFLYVLLAMGMLAVLIAVPFFSTLNTSNYPPPLAIKDFESISFDQTYSNASFVLKPTIPFLQQKDTYDTFYVWTQRLGYVPSYQQSFDEAIETSDIIIFINPNVSFDLVALTNLEYYLEKGGHIILLDGIQNKDSTANQLLKTVNMTLTQTTAIQNNSSGKNTQYLRIDGGIPLFTNISNQTFVSYEQTTSANGEKAGILIVCVDSARFKDEFMGGVFTEPTDEQRALYNIEYLLFNQLQT